MRGFFADFNKQQSPSETAELYQFFVRQTPHAIQGNVSLLIICFLAAPNAEFSPLVEWGGILALLLCIRYFVYWLDGKYLSVFEKCSWLPITLSVLTSLVWGVLPWVLDWNSADDQLLFIPFLLAGLAAGGVIISVASKITCLLFPLLILSVGILPLCWFSPYPNKPLFFMIAIYMVFLLRIGIMFNAILRKSFIARLEVQELNQSLQRKSDELQQQNDNLKALGKKIEAVGAAKDEFLARMSHEIRTPLHAVIGMSIVGLEDGTLEGMRESLGLVQNSADHLLSIVNDVLDFSKIESGSLTIHNSSFDLRHEINALTSIIKQQAQAKELWFSVSIDSNVPSHIISDNLRIRQILINFLGNACKFTPKGGTVTLSIVSEFSKKYNNSVLKFTVTDTGVGIKFEDQRKIFGSFVQLNEDKESLSSGAGLGLAISDRLAKLLGGEIVLKSALGEGSSFSLIIPVIEDVSLRDLDSGETTGHLHESQKPLHVLVAEDNFINQRLIEKILMHDGHSVVLAENGSIALEKLKEGNFDVILMDCSMPVMDGYTATKNIRASGSKIPIIALTAHALAGAREECIAAGMNEYLTKPLDRARLKRLLSRVAMGLSQKASPTA